MNDALLQGARRHAVATASAADVTGSHVLPVPGHALTCVVPESLPEQRWWWCQLGRRNEPFTTAERKLVQLLMRQWRGHMNHVPPPGLGHLILGHDDRVIHADPGTELHLLAHPALPAQLVEALGVVVSQRWPDADLTDEHDFAIEMDGKRYWICFRRLASIDEATAQRWCLELRPLAEGELQPIGAIDSPRIAQSIAYLHDHYRERPSLTRVAKAIGASPFHFHRQFSRVVGVSPKRYLQLLQLQVAKWQLRSSRTAIGMIAQRTGFSSHGLFTCTFNRLAGMSPSEYREGG